MSLESKNELSKVFPISLAETVVVPVRHAMMTLPPTFKGALCGDKLEIVDLFLRCAKQRDFLLARLVMQP